tara:strand:+ start:169 stop:456 length:288 start_codon:yes stop_codon:yes gene_type:complete
VQVIKKFFHESYVQSPFAFWCEAVETVLLIGASFIITYTILDPATWLFVPLYLVGSALGIISSWIRRAGMVIFLCSWFTLMNAIALFVLVMDYIK